jgi:hypothetical protein
MAKLLNCRGLDEIRGAWFRLQCENFESSSKDILDGGYQETKQNW